jgi:hypothetical protein
VQRLRSFKPQRSVRGSLWTSPEVGWFWSSLAQGWRTRGVAPSVGSPSAPGTVAVIKRAS